MFERTVLTVLVWGLLLSILSAVYLSSTPERFEFAYSLFIMAITSVALIITVWRLKVSARRTESPLPNE